ncbi:MULTISPECIES: hypothetical protein [unclassified Neglectibacter]|jgi:hypothetical protein|uniref:DUF7678 domain-containing protein n=1 Tax=unclassified Neglectibacter TaxID=2632164 RepID=UPI00191BF55C|nr:MULTISPECIES: hypothetical protein [unclassified Neglectibacter]
MEYKITTALCRGWFKGTIGKYSYSAKVYDTPSRFGINHGRVSKLAIYDEDKRRREGWEAACIVNYDRGWDVRPKDKEAKDVLKSLLPE